MKKRVIKVLLTLVLTAVVLAGFAVSVNAGSTTAKVTGVTIKVNGVEQAVGPIRFNDGDEITLIFSGENFSKLNTNYKYKMGPASGTIGIYGFFTVDTSVTPNTATKTFTSTTLKSTVNTTVSYTNAGESETVTGFTLAYGEEEPAPLTAKVTGVTVKVNGVEQEVGEVSFTDGDEITVVYYGENFDKLNTNFKYRVGPSSGTIGTYGFFTVDTTVTPNTATKTFASTTVQSTTKNTVSYTNDGESETVTGYTLVYMTETEEPPVSEDAKVTGVTVKVNGVEQEVGEVSFTDGDEITVVYYGENFDKLNTNFKYRVGPSSGTIGIYGFFTVDTTVTPNTATKTFASTTVQSTTKNTVSYTNDGESETVTGYTLMYVTETEEPPVSEDAKVTGVTVKVNGVEQEVGEVSFTDGDEITVVYYGENFDKLNTNFKYRVGPSSGTISIYGFFTVDTTVTPNTATKTFSSTTLQSSANTTVSYTNAGESETVTGYTLNYQEKHTYNSYGYCTDCQVNIEGVSITVGASLSVNYYVNLIDASLVGEGESLVMKFTKNGKTTDLVAGELQANGLYKFVYENVAPQCMADLIDSALYIAKGDSLTQIAGNSGYTIRDNAKSLLSLYPDDEKLVRLVTDMLYYGKSAQEYRGYNIADLATDGVDGLAEQGTALPTVTAKNLEMNADGNAKFTAAGLWFDSVNKIYVKLNTTQNVTLKVNGEAVTLSDTVYYTDGILATEFDDEYTFELYEGETLVQTLTYSVNSYVYSMKDNSNMSEHVKALYNYGLAAKAYAE
ncbi:MAG: hypothetical protein E7613_05995 [Ruminococcaceae bacterium]|nr:hypothetical protein [Oscillospiraceae bacterium]